MTSTLSFAQALKSIKDFELSLVNNLDKAKIEANKKIEQAKEKAKKILEDIIQKIETERKEIQKYFEVEVKNKLIEIDATTQKKLNEIEVKAKSNKDAAINLILKYVFGEIDVQECT